AESQALRLTDDFVARLHRLRRAGVAPAGLDHVGVERSLDEPAHVAELAGLVLEHADERLADALALLLGVGHALEPREEAPGRVDVHERNVEVASERLDDLRGLVLPEQTVVDEHARELVA